MGVGVYSTHLPYTVLRVRLCIRPVAGILALSTVQSGGDSFKPKYLKILSSGGSEAPEKILSDAGIDIRSPKFWQGGFDVLSRMVDELEKL